MRETSSTIITLDPRGCVIVRPRAGVVQTLDHAKENVRRSLELSGNKPCPLLVDLRKVEPLTSEVRHYYTGGALAENFTALALLLDSFALTQMMGNVFARLMDNPQHRKPKVQIETRLFTDEDEAIEWLTSRDS